MGQKKIRIGVVFGGRSAEHEVSLQSARNVVNALDRSRYEITLIGVDRDGTWYLNDSSAPLLEGGEDPRFLSFEKNAERQVALVPDEPRGHLVRVKSPEHGPPLDVVFPAMHGPYGEDGSLQGLFQLLDVPCVGAGVLGSAVGMDKDVMKRLWRDAGLPQGRWMSLTRAQLEKVDFATIVEGVGCPCFLKPANLGSSVGVSRVDGEDEFHEAALEALSYDLKILVEEAIEGREIECSVLGNDEPAASLPGEIVTDAKHEFYSYEAKYLDETGAVLEIPANLPAETIGEVQRLAVEAFKIVCCSGMARVDFFLKEDGTLLLNEINTIPGFTNISMYPKLWEASGLPQSELIDRLIELAIEERQKKRRLKSSYRPKELPP